VARVTKIPVEPAATSAQAVPASSSFLTVSGLLKSFAARDRGTQAAKILDDISFSIGEGEFVTVIGPSGCGKSTLLTCLAGLTATDGGTIQLDGTPVLCPRSDTAVVFQQPSLLPWRSIESNVGYGLELRGDLPRREIRRRVAEVLELVGLTAHARHYPHQISGGMRQRANVARALVVDPKVVLMDEPFGALDALTRETMQNELMALASRYRRTTVFITHDIEEAVFLADKILVMAARPGRIAAEVPVTFPRPRNRGITETPEFTGLIHRLRELVRTPGTDQKEAE
jgi:NitT/TauT family transport system ATP-binding protein